MRLLLAILSWTILTTCSHGRIASPSAPGFLQTIYGHSRKPASEITARTLTNINDVEILVSDIDRCEEIPLSQKLSDNQIHTAVERLKRVSTKFDSILSKIRKVNPERASILSKKLKRLAIVLDGSDSVDCGAVASINIVNGEYRPVIFVSIANASEKSWNTVLPHEFGHLVFKSFDWDGGPLREVWPDLLSLSANSYRPYFAEGDGERTLRVIDRNSRDRETTEVMKESYSYSCVSQMAQRDFRKIRPVSYSYRGMEIHNISCEFVSIFLHFTKTAEKRDALLYNFLFAGSNRPNLASADFADVLNELLEKELVGRPIQIPPDPEDTVSIQLENSSVKLQISLSQNTRNKVIHNVARPIAIQLEDGQYIAVTKTQYLDLYEPTSTGDEVKTCNSSNTIDCWCFSGNPTTMRLFFLGEGRNQVFSMTLKERLSIPNKCYQF